MLDTLGRAGSPIVKREDLRGSFKDADTLFWARRDETWRADYKTWPDYVRKTFHFTPGRAERLLESYSFMRRLVPECARLGLPFPDGELLTRALEQLNKRVVKARTASRFSFQRSKQDEEAGMEAALALWQAAVEKARKTGKTMPTAKILQDLFPEIGKRYGVFLNLKL